MLTIILYSVNFTIKIIASDINEVMMILYWSYECDSMWELYHNFMTEIKYNLKRVIFYSFLLKIIMLFVY